jgi:predicted membrane-bound spermidine synthase
VSALVLFSPSLTMRGMVSPFAIKLATTRSEGVGRSSGAIYAVSTVGSVIGTLLLGFWILPLVGSREVLLGMGLLLLAAPIALYERRRLVLPQSVWIVAVLAVLGLFLVPGSQGAGRAALGGDKYRLVSEKESLYGWVRVIDQHSRDLRVLTSDASAIGAASLRAGQSILSYQDIVALIPALRPKMAKALIIGLGAGHMKDVLYDRSGSVADTLEIDPAVAAAAVEQFGFQPSGRMIVGDARYEIRHLAGPYDLIIHDCFTGGSEPAHLLTVEALAQLRGLLSPDGILAVKLVSFAAGPNSAVLAAVGRTIDQHWPHR